MVVTCDLSVLYKKLKNFGGIIREKLLLSVGKLLLLFWVW
jgi:hypothetical protein